jgi:hypothetical protein
VFSFSEWVVLLDCILTAVVTSYNTTARAMSARILQRVQHHAGTNY